MTKIEIDGAIQSLKQREQELASIVNAASSSYMTEAITDLISKDDAIWNDAQKTLSDMGYYKVELDGVTDEMQELCKLKARLSEYRYKLMSILKGGGK